MLWRFLLFIDEMQSFLLNVAVHLLNPPAASLVITTTSSGGHFYYCIIIATPCGGHSTSILLQPTLAAILLLPHPFNLRRLWPSRLLIYHYCNLFWRIFCFHIITATSLGDLPTSIVSLQPTPAVLQLLLHTCIINLSAEGISYCTAILFTGLHRLSWRFNLTVRGGALHG